jgi:Rap guanine nucleotide exchange factor 4
VDVISQRLRRVEQLDRLPNSVLQQLAFCGYYEDLEKGVTREYMKHFFVS